MTQGLGCPSIDARHLAAAVTAKQLLACTCTCLWQIDYGELYPMIVESDLPGRRSGALPRAGRKFRAAARPQSAGS